MRSAALQAKVVLTRFFLLTCVVSSRAVPLEAHRGTFVNICAAGAAALVSWRVFGGRGVASSSQLVC